VVKIAGARQRGGLTTILDSLEAIGSQHNSIMSQLHIVVLPPAEDSQLKLLHISNLLDYLQWRKLVLLYIKDSPQL
jgi:hypothetical protein